MHTQKLLRIAQAGLLLGALLTGLTWFEQPTAQATSHAVGRETLEVRVEAPALHPRGPWTGNTTFTHTSPGIPLDVAPHASIIPRYTAAGPGVEPGSSSWTVTLVIRERGDAGNVWWSVEEELPILGEGREVRVPLNLTRVVERARSLDAGAGVPGNLDMHVRIEHRGTPTVQGEPRSTTHRATLGLSPDANVLILRPQGDSTDYARTTETARSLPLLPLGLAGLALAVEPLHLGLRRGSRPWEHSRGVRVVEVEHLPLPPDAPRASLDEVLEAARHSGRVVLVDPAGGCALLSGDTPLWATLPREVPEDEELRG